MTWRSAISTANSRFMARRPKIQHAQVLHRRQCYPVYGHLCGNVEMKPSWSQTQSNEGPAFPQWAPRREGGVFRRHAAFSPRNIVFADVRVEGCPENDRTARCAKNKRYTLWHTKQPRKDIGVIAFGQGKVSKRTRLTPFPLTTGYAGSQADHIVQRRHKDLSRQGPAQRTKLRSSLSCLPAKDTSRLGF